jgi:hypothetical protein
MTQLYGEGLLPREIQQMLQMGFGSWSVSNNLSLSLFCVSVWP